MTQTLQNDLRRIAVEIITIMRWIQTAHRHNNAEELPENLKNLISLIKAMYLRGGDELQPGGLCALTVLEESLDAGGAIMIDRRQEIGNEVFESTLKCFAQEWQGPLLVALNVEICRLHLNAVIGAPNGSETLKTYKKLLDAVNFIVSHVSENSSKGQNQTKTSTILLCLNQIKNCLPLFLTGFEEDCSVVQKYAANCLMECLDRIQKESCETTNLSCSEFIDLMDSGLNLLDDLIENTREWMSDFQKKVQNLKEIIDELLCHSMSTAQVAATEEDKRTILNKSQKILHNIETLKDDLAGDDMSAVILSAHTVSDGLCELERAVNSAVLRLVLEINSGLEDPLRDLIDMTRPSPELSDSKGIRRASDLDEATTKFDAFMDKLMQIGTFAVSCSSNIKKAVQLRSCLASFESLESELIPSITALYLDPSKPNKKNLRIFVDHWFKESAKFRAVLDTIVDPAAFIDVVRSSLNELFKTLEESVDACPQLIKFTKVAKTLNGILETSIHQDSADNVAEIKVLARKVSQSIENCERLSNKLRIANCHIPHNEITKRAQLLIESVDSVWEYLVRKIVDACPSDLDDESLVNPKLHQPIEKNYYQLCPVDCETPAETDVLKSLQRKGTLLRKEAVLYNTPKRSTAKRPEIKATPITFSTVRKSRLASVARSHCFRSSVKVKRQADLTDMELTALLEDLSKLDCTFSLNETLKPKKENNEFHGRKLLDLFTGWDSLLEETPQFETTEAESGAVPGSTIGSSDTPQRFNDLLLVDEKIKKLKELTE